jgi:hypothetical protein
MVSVSRFAPAPHWGASAVDEIGTLVQRVAGTVRHAVFRQHHRQLVIRNRHIAAAIAMDDRDGAAPVALARYAPVAQAPLDLLFTQIFCGQVVRDCIHGSLVAQTIVFA